MTDTTEADANLVSSSLDPFQALHPDVFELILQHLPGKTVKNASEVSQLWFEVTEASTKCNEKLKVIIGTRTNMTDFTSRRRYQNLYFQYLESYGISHYGYVEEFIDGRFFDNRNWKYLRADRLALHKRHLVEILKIIEPTIERLELVDVQYIRYCMNGDDLCTYQYNGYYNGFYDVDEADECNEAGEYDEIKFTFPNLTHLELRSYHFESQSPIGFLIEMLADNCTTLKHLNAHFYDEYSFSYTCYDGVNDYDERPLDMPLAKVLANNENLEELVLCDTYPLKSLENHRFKLKKFDFDAYQHYSDELDINLLSKFIESQAENIEALSLGNCCGKRALTVALKMPKLRELKLFHCLSRSFKDHWAEFNFNTSSSLEKFDIVDEPIDFHENIFAATLTAMLDAMPNLKSLEWAQIKEDLYDTICNLCPKIEKISGKFLADLNPEESR